MGSFQACETCTEAPPATTSNDEQLNRLVEITDLEEVKVPAMADESGTNAQGPVVLPETPSEDDASSPQPVLPDPPLEFSTPSDVVDANQSDMLDETTAIPTTSLVAAVVSAVAKEVAGQTKNAIEAATSSQAQASLLTGVSDSSSQLKKPFSLTWVMYDVDDPFGQLLALVTLSPVFIMVMYATLLVFQRDLHIAFLLLGQRTIDQKRPDGADMEDAGMPSAHSQFMAFFATYVVLYTSNRMSKRREWEQKLAIVGVIVLALLVFVSRIRLGYHSIAQVLVGATVGAGTGILWYIFMENIAMPMFPAIASWDISQRLFIRDCTHIPDLVVFHHRMTQRAGEAPPPVNAKYHGM
ncbi:hypothetical protein H310_06820 [Aphanomyces invadans]|uniref:Dolichyldiphosphatase n=1 Tax=Aphanomyces invadans TaxID=157072 RepID=A0A024U4Q8_9STRA|nr:hypothetical protein H310_06820 [Aphanomyces invadans]ETW01234.1 hypothetical protein H310_06820 [Aphanomyces invadans]|eukprot:XP_008870232.1 hypothetical protein H310_06820 [Aphanomyces invadans]